MKKNVLTLIIILFAPLSYNTLHAQADAGAATEKPKDKTFDLALEGMLGISAAENFVAFNVGGPNLKLKLTKHLGIGVGAFPSFYFKEGSAGGKLGVSPRIDYKNLILIAPAFHFENSHKWVYTFGMAYRFSKAH